MAKTLKNIAIIGANGHLGPSILSALLSANDFTVTVLSRQSSQSKYSAPIHDIRIPDALPATADLTAALRGQDVLICAFAGTNEEIQLRLADACVAAGVRRFVPADFGSCDSENDLVSRLLPKLYGAKKRVREHLQSLEGQGNGFAWTSLVCGHFFDYGLGSGLLGFDLQARKARVFDGGDGRWSACTLAMVGRAVVAVLRKEEDTKNQVFFVQSFCVSQNDVLKNLKRYDLSSDANDGTKPGGWEVEDLNSEPFITQTHDRLQRDPGDGDASEDLVMVLGIRESNREDQTRHKAGCANELLGLEEEDLDAAIRRVVERFAKGTT